MKFANATKFNRKSGETEDLSSPHRSPTQTESANLPLVIPTGA